MAASVGGEIKLFGLKFVQINVEVDIDDAGLLPMSYGDGDTCVWQGNSRVVIGSDGASLAVRW